MLVHIELSISFFSICDKSIFWYDCIVYLHRDDLINMLPRFVKILIFWRLHNRVSAWEWTADRGGNGPERCFLQFCPYTAQEDTGVGTGACRSARTSKPVNCKITVRLQHHTNYKTPYDEKQSVSNGKWVRHRRPDPLCGKKGTYTPASCNHLRCRQLGDRGTRKLTTAKRL